MSHSPSPVTTADVRRIVTEKPFQVTKVTTLVLWLLVAVGAVTFALGVMSDEVRLTWISFHVNLIFWMTLAAASAGFSAVFHICNAQWSRPLRRLFESTVYFLPVAIALLVVFYLGHGHIFVWAHLPIAGKGAWLSSNLVFVRDVIAYGLIAYVSSKVIRLSLARDFMAIRGGLTGVSQSETTRWSGAFGNAVLHGIDQRNPRAAIREITANMGRLSPVNVIVYAVGISLIAFDLVMSVDPHWYSTLFGAFIFMSAVYATMAWASITMGFARETHPLFRAKIERRTLHDLGKLLFGFGIFWAYLFWSHYLTIWYGNIPEETQWVITRLRLEPWHSFAWVIFGSSFIVPFFLGLNRDLKQVPQLLFATAVIVMVGLWLQMYLLIAPSLYKETIPLGSRDVFISLGFMALFFLCQIRFLSQVPLMPFGDFYGETADSDNDRRLAA